MLIQDENDLRAGLRALSAGTPGQPPARAEAAVGRARQLRRRRTAATAAAVVLPALLAGAVVTRASAPRRLPPAVDARLLPTAERVFTAWDRDHDLRPGERVRWTHAWRYDTRLVFAAFETCAGDVCSRRVFGHVDEGGGAARAGFHTRVADDGVPWEPYRAYFWTISSRAPFLRVAVLLAGDQPDRVVLDATATRGAGRRAEEIGEVAEGVFATRVPDELTAESITAYAGDRILFSAGTDRPLDAGPLRPRTDEPRYAPGHVVRRTGAAGARLRLYGTPGTRYALVMRCGGQPSRRYRAEGEDVTATCGLRQGVVDPERTIPASGAFVGAVAEGTPDRWYEFALVRPST